MLVMDAVIKLLCHLLCPVANLVWMLCQGCLLQLIERCKEVMCSSLRVCTGGSCRGCSNSGTQHLLLLLLLVLVLLLLLVLKASLTAISSLRGCCCNASSLSIATNMRCWHSVWWHLGLLLLVVVLLLLLLMTW